MKMNWKHILSALVFLFAAASQAESFTCNSLSKNSVFVNSSLATAACARIMARCDVFKPCPFPASCVNGRCEKSNGDGVECDVFKRCPFPASCVSGRCERPNGDGVECDLFNRCDFPERCQSGRCVR